MATACQLVGMLALSLSALAALVYSTVRGQVALPHEDSAAALPMRRLVQLQVPATRPAAETAAAPGAPSSRSLFDGARVAVLLTGQAFRTAKRKSVDPSGVCVNASYEAQRTASQSIVTNVIEPLEDLGANVEILYTFPSCDTFLHRGLTTLLQKALDGWLGVHRVVSRRVVQSRNVGHSWQQAFMLLAEHMSLQRPRRDYDFVFSVRHDLQLLKPLTNWSANLSKLNFLGEFHPDAEDGAVTLDCEPDSEALIDKCTGTLCWCAPKAQDKLLWVPRSMLPSVLKHLVHDDWEHPVNHRRGDSSFNPHYFVQHYLYAMDRLRDHRFHGAVLVNASCPEVSDRVRVMRERIRVRVMRERIRRNMTARPTLPPSLRATFAPNVGLLCESPNLFFRFAPERGWN